MELSCVKGRSGKALLLPNLSPKNKFGRLENQQCAKIIKERINPRSHSSKSQMVGAEPPPQWLPGFGALGQSPFLGLVPYLCTSLFFHMEADWAFGTRSTEFTSSSMRSLKTEIEPKLALPPLTQERTLAQIFPKYHRSCNTHGGVLPTEAISSTALVSPLSVSNSICLQQRRIWPTGLWAIWKVQFLHYWLLVICIETKHTTKPPQLLPVCHLGEPSTLSE